MRDLATTLQRLYDSEIPCNLGWLPDGGVDFILADWPMLASWRTIETAPMDGTDVLVENGEDDGLYTNPYQIGTAAWTEYDGIGKPNWISTACCDRVSSYKPTRWMPLPTSTNREDWHNVRTIAELADALHAEALRKYPESKYAKENG